MSLELTIEFETECDHGIVVIESLGTRATHASWDPATQRHHLDGDSLYVVAMPSVDGTVVIEAYRGAEVRDQFPDLGVLFEGVLQLDRPDLLIGDSDGNEERTVVTTGSSLLVTVLGDSPQFSERVVIGLQEQPHPELP